MKTAHEHTGSCSDEERNTFCEKWDQTFYDLEKAYDSVEYFEQFIHKERQ